MLCKLSDKGLTDMYSPFVRHCRTSDLVGFKWFLHFLHHCKMADICEDALALVVFPRSVVALQGRKTSERRSMRVNSLTVAPNEPRELRTSRSILREYV